MYGIARTFKKNTRMITIHSACFTAQIGTTHKRWHIFNGAGEFKATFNTHTGLIHMNGASTEWTENEANDFPSLIQTMKNETKKISQPS